jgi:hypothetical protein
MGASTGSTEYAKLPNRRRMMPGIGSGDRSITLTQSVNQIVPKTISEIPAAFRTVAIVVFVSVNVEIRRFHALTTCRRLPTKVGV